MTLLHIATDVIQRHLVNKSVHAHKLCYMLFAICSVIAIIQISVIHVFLYSFFFISYRSAQLLYFGSESTMPASYLPSGDENDNYQLPLVVEIRDAYGAAMEYLLNVRVSTE